MTPIDAARKSLDRLLHWRRPPASQSGQGVLLHPRRGARVHLGCGDVHLHRYLNIDLPSTEGSTAADLEADLRDLRCPSNSLAEIRLHHVFEHFDRVEALALLLRWHDWLEPRGVLTIETPDFDSCAELYLQADGPSREVLLRHIFGSHEAPWAVHRDGWSERRFREVLARLGFETVSVHFGSSDEAELLRNITIQAEKRGDGGKRDERLMAARRSLEDSLSGRGESEIELLAIWHERLDELQETEQP